MSDKTVTVTYRILRTRESLATQVRRIENVTIVEGELEKRALLPLSDVTGVSLDRAAVERVLVFRTGPDFSARFGDAKEAVTPAVTGILLSRLSLLLGVENISETISVAP